MSDLVKHLREAEGLFDDYLCGEAADEIEAKDAAIAELLGVLKVYKRAGFGNSTDFDTQALADILARAAIAKYDK